MNNLRIAVLIVASAATCFVTYADDGDSHVARDQQALAAWQVLVGEWRGVGQPKRGSNRDAWREESEWSWHYVDGRAELQAEITDGRFFKRLQLQPGEKPGQFVLLVTPRESAGEDKTTPSPLAGEGRGDGEGAGNEDSKSDVEPTRFAGSAVDGALVLTVNEADAAARVTIRTVADGDRLIVLYEKATGGGSFVRQGEVASTRKGSAFATAAAAGRECVVTGGLGTIAVEHEGRTYYVCCSGCRDLFNDDPAGVLENYRQRKAAEREEKEKGR